MTDLEPRVRGAGVDVDEVRRLVVDPVVRGDDRGVELKDEAPVRGEREGVRAGSGRGGVADVDDFQRQIDRLKER